jgi:hypothetical protein
MLFWISAGQSHRGAGFADQFHLVLATFEVAREFVRHTTAILNVTLKFDRARLIAERAGSCYVRHAQSGEGSIRNARNT